MKVAGVGRRIVPAALMCGVTAIWALALAAPAGALPSGCSQVQRTVTCTFSFTGSEQTFSVPAGIGSVQVDAVGAPGAGSAGGLGGSASATVPVTSGETLYVEVGGVGDSGPSSFNGGFNGGGRADANAQNLGGAGGGGGASDVRTESSSSGAGSLSTRLVVAAGGGGSGAVGNGSGSLGHGGAADTAGTDGHANGSDDGGGGGGAGTSSVGGTAGAAGAAPSGTPGGAGHVGTSGVGGDGTGGPVNTTGGGGGGGYFGGGGGGGGGASSGPTAEAGGGGGGGGSCFALGAVACGANSSTTPLVTITYTLPDTTAPTISIASPGANAAYPLGASVPASYSCADEAGGSGLATCQGTVASGAAIDTSTAGAHTFTVSAVDGAGNTATQTVDYTVVGTPPTPPSPSAPSVSILSPIAGHTYRAEQRVPARYTCTEGAFGPGIKSCTGTVRSGGLINTQSLGRLKFKVTAVSDDGQTSSKTVTYSVRAPRVVSSASYFVSIQGQQTKWVFTHLVALHQPQKSCTHSGPIRVCQNGNGKPASFTLRAPLTDDTSLLSWNKTAKNSPDDRKTIVLEEIIPTSSLKSKTGTTTVRWQLTRAWPSKLSVTGNRTIATVTVTFTGTALTVLNP